MNPYRIRLDPQRHAAFLNEGRKDPVTKEPLSPGMVIVICAHDKVAFVADYWTGTCPLCGGTQTLADVPQNTLPSRIGGRSPAAQNPTAAVSGIQPRPEIIGGTRQVGGNNRRNMFLIVFFLFICAIPAYMLTNRPATLSMGTATPLQSLTTVEGQDTQSSESSDANQGMSNILVGKVVRVSENVVQVSMRSSPGYLEKANDDVIISISAGQLLRVIDGPTMKDGISWWYVQWKDKRGWVAENSNTHGTILESTHIDTTEDIQIGYTVRISGNIQTARMRRTPGYKGKSESDIVATLPSGTQIVVVSGPEQADNLLWWYVRWNDAEGWVAEYDDHGIVIIELVR